MKNTTVTLMTVLCLTGISQITKAASGTAPVAPTTRRAYVEYCSTTAVPNQPVTVTVRVLDVYGTQFWSAPTPSVYDSVFDPHSWSVPQCGTWIRTLSGVNVIVTFADVDGFHSVTARTSPNGWATVQYWRVDRRQASQLPFRIVVPQVVVGVIGGAEPFCQYQSDPAEGVTGGGCVSPPKPALQTVALLAPAHYRTGVRLNPTLKWTPAVGATQYEVVITRDDGGGRRLVLPASVGGSWTVDPPLRSNRLYVWKARALSAAGAGAYSEEFCFRTQ